MLTLKCKACNATMNHNYWIESIQDYNDLCSTCLDAIGLATHDPDSLILEANELLGYVEEENEEEEYVGYEPSNDTNEEE